MREHNRSRREIRLLECREVTPEQVSFPGARLIARLLRRVRRKAKKSTETVYLISSLTLEELDALGWIKLKRDKRPTKLSPTRRYKSRTIDTIASSLRKPACEPLRPFNR